MGYVDFFAVGTWRGRRWHVVQLRLELEGRVGCKWLYACILLMAVRTARPCHCGAARRCSKLAL
jgi:hypothetical protein